MFTPINDLDTHVGGMFEKNFPCRQFNAKVPKNSCFLAFSALFGERNEEKYSRCEKTAYIFGKTVILPTIMKIELWSLEQFGYFKMAAF